MEDFDATPPRTSDRAWGLWLGLLILIVILNVALQLIPAVSKGESAAGVRVEFLISGDYSVRYAVAGIDVKAKAKGAVAFYESALPSPAAYRRIGITKIALLHQPGVRELQLLASKAATKSLPKDHIAKLKAEAAMWAEVFGQPRMSKTRGERIAREVSKLNLGPLRDIAVAEVLRRSDQAFRAKAALANAKKKALVKVGSFSLLILLLIGGGIAGIVIAITFFNGLGGDLKTPIAAGAPPSILLRAFFVFLVGSFVLEGLFIGLVGFMAGGSPDNAQASSVLLQISATLAAIALAITYLGNRTPNAGNILREIGLRGMSLVQSLKWAVGGYCAALPFLLVAYYITQILLRTVLRGIPTPEHPLVPTVESGGALTWAAAIVLAVVAAPIVEEIAFRGLLYTALRARMGMWASVIISGTVFAALHPTIPAQFLLLSVLGCAFAVIRERSRSLIPSMICHGINNGVMLLALWLIS